MIWADYSGGKIIKGHLLGTVSENGELDFYYQHINKQYQMRVEYVIAYRIFWEAEK